MAGNAAESGRTVTSKVTAILLAFSRGTTHTLGVADLRDGLAGARAALAVAAGSLSRTLATCPDGQPDQPAADGAPTASASSVANHS
jgi:hypothetical protein